MERSNIPAFNDWLKLNPFHRLIMVEIILRLRCRWLSLFAGFVICCFVSESSAAEPKITQSQTASGVRFFYLGDLPASPSPTLFFLAADGESTLRDPNFLQCGVELQKAGYLCISIELPGHGGERRDGEPEGLAAWRTRIDAGENPFIEVNARIAAVIDHLVAAEYADPTRLAVCGVSRGGFAALHASATEPRLRCVVLYSPVTNLSALSEFKDVEQTQLMREMDLASIVEKLQERDVWLTIGDHDERVDTDAAVQFARRLSNAAAICKASGRIELQVCPAEGHTTPVGAAQKSAEWIRRRFD